MSEFSGSFICVIFMDKQFVQIHVAVKEKALFGFPSPNFGAVPRGGEWSGSCLPHFPSVASAGASFAAACST